jgi:hypothetical protein
VSVRGSEASASGPRSHLAGSRGPAGGVRIGYEVCLVKISIGLPTALPGTPASVSVPWAQRAEAAGFAGLGTIGRTVYDSYDELCFWVQIPGLDQIDRLAEAVF